MFQIHALLLVTHALAIQIMELLVRLENTALHIEQKMSCVEIASLRNNHATHWTLNLMWQIWLYVSQNYRGWMGPQGCSSWTLCWCRFPGAGCIGKWPGEFWIPPGNETLTSLGSLSQHSAILKVKLFLVFVWSFPNCGFRLLLLVLSVCTTEMSLAFKIIGLLHSDIWQSGSLEDSTWMEKIEVKQCSDGNTAIHRSVLECECISF